jgi:hypothetical protein
MSTAAKKDVIYVDIEDDITSVIEKVKGAKTPIVALVPPKRIGVLQSVVNLKLLQRAATGAKKRVVLITNDQSLISLAAGVAMPVAKNLQSRPALPTALAVTSDEEEVINGEELPVGELEKTSDQPLELTGFPTASNVPASAAPAAAATAPFAAKAAARAPKKGSAVPDFDKFRKKLFIFGGAGALLLIFLVWAIFFAGKATVAITANTNIVNFNKVLQLRPDARLDARQAVAQAVVKEVKRSDTVDFTATGKKDVGDKATGTVKFSTNNISNLGTTIPAGTPLTASGGLTFLTDSSVTITISNYTGATTGVTALESGSKFNGATGSVSGAPSGISASLTEETAGGTDKTVTVVSQADIDKATEKLEAEDSNKIKEELKKQFNADIVTINESFAVEPGDPKSSPGVGQEASSAKLTAETTYRLVGVARSDLRAIYDTYTKSQIAGEKNQKIYESGDETTAFTEFSKTDNGYSVRAQATAQVGPNIDDKALAAQLTGKRAGEIQQQIEQIQGVEDVEVKFSPFWVTKAPSKADKISIKFVVKNDQN